MGFNPQDRRGQSGVGTRVVGRAARSEYVNARVGGSGGREMPYSGSASPVDPVSTSARMIARILPGSTIRGRRGGHQ